LQGKRKGEGKGKEKGRKEINRTGEESQNTLPRIHDHEE